MAEETQETKAGGNGGKNPPKNAPRGAFQRMLSIVGSYGVGAVACILVILVITVISAILYKNGGVLRDLADPANARGIITFMISLAAIGLAFLMVLHGLFGNSEAEQFRRAREIYSGLMGVLGTIVGFYFGSSERPIPPLTVSEPRILGQEMIMQASGGVPPYRYHISPDTLSGMADAEERLSKDGWIQHPLKAAPGATRLRIEVWDTKNAVAAKEYRP